MGRNKKDATQDVLNLYNQMQEDENIESGKEEIKVTLKEIESAKKALYEAKEELGNAYRRLESAKVALVAAHRSTDNIVDSICHAIVKAEQSNLKVGINDEGVAQLDKRNNTAISAFKQALDEHEKRIGDCASNLPGCFLFLFIVPGKAVQNFVKTTGLFAGFYISSHGIRKKS